MQKDSRDGLRQTETSTENRFACAAKNATAAFRAVGNRMKRMVEAPSGERIRNLRGWSVSREFRPKGGVYRCFFACCAALDSACLCDGSVVRRFLRKADWFGAMLAGHLGQRRAVAEFLVLVGRMGDLAESGAAPEARRERQKIMRLSEDVFYRLSVHAQERDARLRVPARSAAPVADDPGGPPGGNDAYLVQDAKIDRLKKEIAHIGRRQDALRRAEQKDCTNIRRMEVRNAARYRQVVCAISIMAGQNISLRYNCSMAATRVFRSSYRMDANGRYDVPEGAYPTPKALYQFLRANFKEVKDLVDDEVRKPKPK